MLLLRRGVCAGQTTTGRGEARVSVRAPGGSLLVFELRGDAFRGFRYRQAGGGGARGECEGGAHRGAMRGGLPEGVASAVLPLSGAAICAWLLLQPVTGSIADIAASIFGLFYLGFLPSHWLSLRSLPDGLTITLSACLMIVASDIGSWGFGRRFGRRPLSPISPGKTVEGAIGGFVSAMTVGLICGQLMGWPFGGAPGVALGALIALIALVGDLTESMMKRDAGLKDSGDVLPGHGGILDRIDSYLFTPAVVYYAITLAQPIVQN